MAERGYDVYGKGVIKHEGKMIANIDQIAVHIYPEEIFLTIEKTPAIAPLMKPFLEMLDLEITTEVGDFHYIAKRAKVDRCTIEGKKGEIVHFLDVEIKTLEIEKIPK